MKRSGSILVVMMLVMLSLAACGGAPAATYTPAPVRQPAATAAPAGSQMATATKPVAAARATDAPIVTATKAAAAPTATPVPATATLKPAAAPTEDTLTLTSRDDGLDKLTSYRMHWQAQWTTTEAGKTEAGWWEWVEEYAANPKALHWTWTFTDTAKSKVDTMETWQIGDTMYIVTTDADGEAGCVSVSSDDTSSQLQKGLFSPSALGSLSNARFAGTDTVNGVRAKHYTYNEQSLSLRNVGKASGEVWVATDGGYVVKETMQWDGSAALFGGGAAGQGKGSWTWNLTDANKALSIKAPANCESGATGLPVMPDAKEKSSFGDMLTYMTPSKLTAVVDFYKKEMKAAGWTLDAESAPMDAMYNLTFSKDGQKATLTIMSDAKGTTVMINVEKD